MSLRKILLIVVTMLLAGAVFAGIVSALEPEETAVIATLENVRDYAPAADADGLNYAVDGGRLFAGEPGEWHEVRAPEDVLVNAVALSRSDANLLYIGAANELAIYRSNDAGETWVKIPLDTDAIGSVTDVAVDAANRLVYVGTDTDGVHRLRDVGTSMIAAGHLVLDEPVKEVVADSSGMALAFVRTEWHLYRAEEVGLRWVEVENLPSPATAVAIAETNPPTIFVGTASSGVRMSQDGIDWQPVNNGLPFAPGSQLYVHDVAIDPAQPEVLYVSTSVSFGSTVLHTTPVGVAMSTDSAALWNELAAVSEVAVTDLMPVPGHTGAVYALTENSRTPLALGEASAIEVAVTESEAVVETGVNWLAVLAWVFAGLAAIGFGIIVWLDVSRRREPEVEKGVLATEPVRNDQ